ncbi:hypothetical protein PRIC2_011903 [Phytophthora ramorum]
MKMEAFAECEEQKERVKACYGDWFQKLWGGSFDRADCDQETQDFRQCVQDAMQRRKEQEKRKSKRRNDDDYDWMDRTKDKSDEIASKAKTRARQARRPYARGEGGGQGEGEERGVGRDVQGAGDGGLVGGHDQGIRQEGGPQGPRR